MRLRLATFFLAAVAALSSSIPRAWAGGGPQNVAVLINSNDPDSLAVANCFIELRQIPATNVIYVPWELDARATTAIKFRDRMMQPALDELKKRGVLSQIDYIAFSSGYPYLIDCAQLWPGEIFPKTSRPTTSLTSAAFLFQFLTKERKEMFLGNVNLYFAPTVNGKTTSRAFSAAQGWAPNGVADAGGLKYYLCTALGVTHGQGNPASEIIASLRRAKSADGARYRGTIYYMENKDVRSRVRQGGYQAAVAELAAIGVKGVVMPGTAPPNKPDVAGLTTGTSHLPLRTSGSTLLPGALVDNLTSAGGQMLIRPESNPQTRISEFIRLGAAGASGTVVEPFALPSKFPSPALHVHYARGCSLAESFYQAVSAPCHLLIIGDPLCHPWAITPKVTVAGIAAGAAAAGTVVVTPKATYPDSRQASRFELFIDGVRTAETKLDETFTLDTTKLADGWHDVWVVAIDNTPIAVQGGWIGEIQVKNGSDELQLTAEPLATSVAGSFTLTVSGTSSTDAEIYHNSRSLGVIAGGKGTLDVPAALLGRGKAKLTAIQAGTPGVRSRTIVVEIQ